jgi:hypothetical protein
MFYTYDTYVLVDMLAIMYDQGLRRGDIVVNNIFGGLNEYNMIAQSGTPRGDKLIELGHGTIFYSQHLFVGEIGKMFYQNW